MFEGLDDTVEQCPPELFHDFPHAQNGSAEVFELLPAYCHCGHHRTDGQGNPSKGRGIKGSVQCPLRHGQPAGGSRLGNVCQFLDAGQNNRPLRPRIIKGHGSRQDAKCRGQAHYDGISFLQEREPAGEKADHHVQHGGHAGKNSPAYGQPRADDRQHQFAYLGTDVLELVPHLGGLLHAVAGEGQGRICLTGGTHHVVHGFLQLPDVRSKDSKCAFGLLVHQAELLQHGGFPFVAQATQHLFQVGEDVHDAPNLAGVVEHVHPGLGELVAHVHPAKHREGILHQRGGTFGALPLAGHIGEGSGHFLVGDAQAVGSGYQVGHVAGEVCKLACPHTFGSKEGVEYLRSRGVFLAYDGKGLRQGGGHGVQVGESRLASLQRGVQNLKGQVHVVHLRVDLLEAHGHHLDVRLVVGGNLLQPLLQVVQPGFVQLGGDVHLRHRFVEVHAGHACRADGGHAGHQRVLQQAGAGDGVKGLRGPFLELAPAGGRFQLLQFTGQAVYLAVVFLDGGQVVGGYPLPFGLQSVDAHLQRPDGLARVAADGIHGPHLLLHAQQGGLRLVGCRRDGSQLRADLVAQGEDVFYRVCHNLPILLMKSNLTHSAIATCKPHSSSLRVPGSICSQARTRVSARNIQPGLSAMFVRLIIFLARPP